MKRTEGSPCRAAAGHRPVQHREPGQGPGGVGLLQAQRLGARSAAEYETVLALKELVLSWEMSPCPASLWSCPVMSLCASEHRLSLSCPP